MSFYRFMFFFFFLFEQPEALKCSIDANYGDFNAYS